jgi:hypothetical protein
MDPQDAEQVSRCLSACGGLQSGREELELGRATDEVPRSLAFQPLAEVQYCS